MNIEIANRMAALRKQNGLSQEQLAARLGVSRQAVSKWERAESSPDTDNLIALAKLYQVSLDELLKLDPEAEGDAAFARTNALPDESERETEGADDEADAEPEAAQEEEREEDASDGAMWKFQKADGKMDLRIFPYPIVVTLAYLLIGFQFGLWHPGWLLFLTIPVYYTALSSEGGFDLNRVPYPLPVSILYLVAGFALNLWHPGWLIFLTIPLYYTLAGRVIREKVNRVLIELLLVGIIYLIGASLGHWFRLWLLIPALLWMAVMAIRGWRSR